MKDVILSVEYCVYWTEKEAWRRGVEKGYSMYRSKYHTRHELNGMLVSSSIVVPYKK